MEPAPQRIAGRRAHAGAAPAQLPIARATPARVQLQSALRVSSPRDPAEREAEATAKTVMRSRVAPDSSSELLDPPRARSTGIARWREPPSIARFADAARLMRLHRVAPVIARRADGEGSAVSGGVAAEIANTKPAGAPLPEAVQRFMAPRFRADFSGVRIHTSDRAAKLSRKLNAHAFTHGNHVFFAADKFRPDTHEGKELIAHELTHTIQQGGAVQRSADVTVHERPGGGDVHRLGVSDALNFFADQANNIPGFRMFTIVIGVNPINMSAVDRSAANILRAVVEFMPGGGLITQALDRYGVFDKVGTWIEQQLKGLGITGASIKQAITDFLNTLGVTDLLHLGDVWNRAKRIFSEPIDRIIALLRSVVTTVLKFIKDAILKPLAALAAQTPGWDLLKAVLGRDPITGEAVPRTADTLIGGFMKLIGQEEIWENIKKGNAIARAFAWFQGAMAGLMSFVGQIPGLFLQALQSLEIADIVLLPRAFAKVGRVFGNFFSSFVSWAGGTIWDLLEIVFSVVAPAVIGYIKKAAGAFKTILKNPIGFVSNLIAAGKQGLSQFVGNFLKHLKAALIGWLTGALSGAGLYIPQALSLLEVGKFVLSILGITWAKIRGKIVAVIGDKAMQAIETGLDIVIALVRNGPAAAWELIKQKLSDLKDMVIQSIISFVKDKIVTAAVTKLLSMLSPVGAFIQAIIGIYNTVMFFVERMKQIAAVAASVIDSIAAIANGSIGGAANRVESTMAGLLTLVISFLARIAGLGKVSDAVVGFIKRVQARVDQAIDAGIKWIVDKAKAFLKALFGKKDKKDPRSEEQKRKDLAAAMSAAEPLIGDEKLSDADIVQRLGALRTKHKVKTLDLVVESKTDKDETVHIEGSNSPPEKTPSKKRPAEYLSSLTLKRPSWVSIDGKDIRVRIMAEHKKRADDPTSDPSGIAAPRDIFKKSGMFRGKKWARRHVLSSYDMKAHYEAALIKPHKTVGEAGAALKGRGFAPASKKKEDIKPAAQSLLERFHNEVSNLWVGETRENSRLQENADPAPSMYEKTGELRVRTLQAHIQKMANTYGIPGPVPVTVSTETLKIKTEYEVA